MVSVVIILGAWTRLSDAGLGCPDWPGCYGHLDVRKAIDHVNTTNSAMPGSLREAHKTVPEMVHRYFASKLGLVILIIAALSLLNRKKEKQPVKLPLFLLALVIFQGILGKWTVTMGLQPTIVMLHLLGGFTTFTLLVLLTARLYRWPSFLNDCDVRMLKPLASITLVAVILQSPVPNCRCAKKAGRTVWTSRRPLFSGGTSMTNRTTNLACWITTPAPRFM